MNRSIIGAKKRNGKKGKKCTGPKKGKKCAGPEVHMAPLLIKVQIGIDRALATA
jgi:hypothetical protein